MATLAPPAVRVIKYYLFAVYTYNISSPAAHDPLPTDLLNLCKLWVEWGENEHGA